MTIGLIVAIIPYYGVSLRTLYKTETQFLLLGITGILLVATLFSTPINGSKRWLTLGGFNFQVAELAKLVMIVFVSDFVVRRSFEVRNGLDGFFTHYASGGTDNDTAIVAARFWFFCRYFGDAICDFLYRWSTL
ncbi:hypothetical protein PKHYL_39000 [Psychrobacter sp. KH172YL61]|nr:FtsW/RodA/SpoVE family cell cycle protein [Psychrobacter sp. KH172YL61]BBI69709.1 hypothetical protein PKHYL_39000 [Psychrobacter sp. KH172YL61]